MSKTTNDKLVHLLLTTRVLTLSVLDNDTPWAAPVYFVFQKNGFFFFSNPESIHIRCGLGDKKIAGSIFHDADNMEQIFGIQMNGCIKKISAGIPYLEIVKTYVNKFDFLSQNFGRQVLDNPSFFREKFKSDLYGFYPDFVCLTDHSISRNPRKVINLKEIEDIYQ